MTIRLPAEIEDQLRQVAEIEHRSVQHTVLVAIEEYLSLRETAEIVADPAALRGLAEARDGSSGKALDLRAPPARRGIRCVELITGPLLELPYRTGRPQRRERPAPRPAPEADW
jgi:predicted transcriptional regulator